MYLNDTTGHLVAVDTTDANELWRYDFLARAAYFNSPTIIGRHVFVRHRRRRAERTGE
jgi:outer membrane protein assembly factor BamB